MSGEGGIQDIRTRLAIVEAAGGAQNETAVGAISALRVVSAVTGGVSLTNPANAASLASVMGVSTVAASNGDMLTVQGNGVITDPAWAWTPGLPLFCGASGVLNQTAPTSIAARQIGTAVNATTILVDLSDLIILE